MNTSMITLSGFRIWFTRLVVALVVVGLVGCSETGSTSGYDPSLRYSLREDPLVLRLPEQQPAAMHEVGQLDASILKLPELRGELAQPDQLKPAQAQELLQALQDQFGTPAEPKLPEKLGYAAEQLAHGSRVYSRICRACHGLAGDGRGPSGPWMIPPPRDFRPGVFLSALGSSKPRMDDLIQLIKHGVPNSNMQAFDLIADEDLRASAVYTIHLSLRGEVEQKVLKDLLDPSGESEPESITAAVEEASARIAQRWFEGESQNWPSITIPEGEDSLRRGFHLFQSTGCLTCHEDYGRKETYRFNVWGTASRVANLTRGEFRWGKSPDRIAARIRYGLPGVNMPAHPSLTEEQLGDLTNFVRQLPLPDKLPPDVREAVYPGIK